MAIQYCFTEALKGQIQQHGNNLNVVGVTVFSRLVRSFSYSNWSSGDTERLAGNLVPCGGVKRKTARLN